MPIASEPNSDEEPKKSVQADIYNKDYRTSVVNSSEAKPDSLLTHIEGFPWTVIYYSQMLGQDEEVNYLQTNQLPIYQQYLKIDDLEVRVTTTLEQSQDDESGEMEVTGSAICYPFLIPNVGDTFLADIGDGRTGVFSVTNVERKAIFKQSAYEMDYLLFDWYADETKDALDAKVVKKAHFQKDMLKNGQYPILVESEVKVKKRLEKYIAYLLDRFVMEFFSPEFSCFLVPGQSVATYDHYLTKAIFRLYDPHDHPQLRRVRELNVMGERLMDTRNIWNSIMEGTVSFRDVLTQKMRVVTTSQFPRDPRLEGVRWSGIQRVVYPHDPREPVDEPYNSHHPVSGDQFTDPGDYEANVASILQLAEAGGLESPDDGNIDPAINVSNPTPEETPLIHPVLIDDYYVFSENFYKNNPTTQSTLELLTNKTIAGAGINVDYLFQIVEDMDNWGRMERFYYTPVLTALMKIHLRRL